MSILLASIASPRSGAQISYSNANQLWAVYSNDDSASTSLNILYYGDMLGLVYSGIKIMLEGDNQYFYEEFAAIFADINGDGIDDVLTSVTEVNKGTALWWYLLEHDTDTASGYNVKQQVVTSTNDKDIHLVAMGMLGPNLQREIVAVETSNSSNARMLFYDAAQANLVVQSDSNYTLFGSRVTAMVTVGDFDGDGVPEVVLQNNDKLYGLQRTPCGVNVAWQVELPSPITTNIATSCNVMDNTMNIFFATEESLRCG